MTTVTRGWLAEPSPRRGRGWPAEPSPRRGRGWPPARRKAQAENIRRVRPWLRSTGPRTAAGKARARMNGLKHGMRSSAMLRLQCLMRRQRLFLRLLDIMPAREALAALSPPAPVTHWKTKALFLWT